MSAVLESEDRMPAVNAKAGTIEIQEGDWKAYLQYIARCDTDKTLAEYYGGTIAYKRACAMAYLGKRAQLHGGVCSTRHPHIMTPELIAELEAGNRAVRHARYPWLRALMSLLAEIEQIQDEISGTNVFTLVPAAK